VLQQKSFFCDAFLLLPNWSCEVGLNILVLFPSLVSVRVIQEVLVLSHRPVLLESRLTWSVALAVVKTPVHHAMKSFRSIAETATRKCTAAVTATRVEVFTCWSLITRTRCGGLRLSTTEYSTLNNHFSPALVMCWCNKCGSCWLLYCDIFTWSLVVVVSISLVVFFYSAQFNRANPGLYLAVFFTNWVKR